MSGYRHTQPTPRVTILISLAVLALIALISSELRITLVLAIVALAIAFNLFSSLTVEVSEQDLQWYFGPGLLRKRVPLSDITKVEPVRLPRCPGVASATHWAVGFTSSSEATASGSSEGMAALSRLVPMTKPVCSPH
jgi:hypothetical protein